MHRTAPHDEELSAHDVDGAQAEKLWCRKPESGELRHWALGYAASDAPDGPSSVPRWSLFHTEVAGLSELGGPRQVPGRAELGPHL